MHRKLFVIAPLTLAFFATVAGCEPRATKEQCEQMIDHMTELQLEGQSKAVAEMTRELMKETSKELLAECEGKASQSEVQCVIDAKSEADISKCN